MKEEIIIKILNDSATDAEKYGFFQDLKNDSVLRESYYLYKTLYTVSNYDRAKNAEIQSDSFERLWKKLNRNKRFRISEFWYRYAAIFIIALILGFLSRQFISQYEAKQSFVHQIEYTSEKGSVSTIHLEDGSNIWLSSSSKIIILKSPSGEMRVKLEFGVGDGDGDGRVIALAEKEFGEGIPAGFGSGGAGRALGDVGLEGELAAGELVADLVVVLAVVFEAVGYTTQFKIVGGIIRGNRVAGEVKIVLHVKARFPDPVLGLAEVHIEKLAVRFQILGEQAVVGNTSVFLVFKPVDEKVGDNAIAFVFCKVLGREVKIDMV